MNYLDCALKYIRQTGRTFNIGYKEHIHVMKNNTSNSRYSNYVLNTGHTFGTITHNMDVTRTRMKSRFLIHKKNIKLIKLVAVYCI
jgi:hypothetical protein